MAAADGVVLSPSTLTSVIGACAKGKRWREALDVLQTARPLLRRSQAVRPSAGTDMHPDTTTTVLKSGPVENDQGIKPETCLEAASRTGLWIGTKEKENGEGQENSSSSFLSSSSTTRMTCEGWGGADGSSDGSPGKSGGRVDAAYMLTMVACRAAGRYAEALSVVGMFEADGVRGDEMLYRVALKCCAKAGAAVAMGEVAGREGGEVEDWGADGAAIADRILKEMSAGGFVCGVDVFTDVAQVRNVET